LKCFPSFIHNSFFPHATHSRGHARALPVAVVTLGMVGSLLAVWQARAALPRWMQDVIGSSAMEAALYRVMEIPGAQMLYPRPPKEAQGELSGLIGKALQQADLYCHSRGGLEGLCLARKGRCWREARAGRLLPSQIASEG